MNIINLKTRLRNKIKFHRGNSVKIHHSAKIRKCEIFIKGKNNSLIIDENCNFRNVKMEILGDDCTIHIGAGTVNTGFCKLSCREKGTRLIIGKDCLLAHNVMMLTSDGHDIYENGNRINHASDIFIGTHVWLAENVMVLKGANIGEGSVIGANSVVTGKHENNTIAAGIPARKIKENISWDEKLTF